VPRRPIGGTPLSASVIGMVAEADRSVEAGPNPGVIERLRHARARGITLFDLAGARDPMAAATLLVHAFPEPDPDLVVILPSARPGVPAPRVGSASASLIERSAATQDPAADPGLDPARRVTRLSDEPPGDPLGLSVPSGSTLLSGPFSLLDHRWFSSLEQAATDGPLGFFARDPLAGGRLDGSRLGGPWVERGPSGAPVSLRRLEEEYAPVIRLRFLTEGRVRTLAQAAVRYAARPRWVSAVLVPLPAADRLDELLSSFQTRELTDDEVRQVDLRPAASGGHAPAGQDLK
jgi:hypothetical protein